MADSLTNPKLLGDGMSPTALTWAFASWVAKSSGYMLTSANMIMVSGHGRGFSVQKNHALISVLAGQNRTITLSYSNFGFKLPERLELRDELPRNPLGKILKRELRDELRT
ncbi:MAG TPA: hypothetical protein VFD73_14535 [Gemmatimonadales bacterium]|nr:hypothetical protein [Gemmatimonadales bacterium]